MWYKCIKTIDFCDLGNADSSGEDDSDDDDETTRGHPDTHDMVTYRIFFFTKKHIFLNVLSAAQYFFCVEICFFMLF